MYIFVTSFSESGYHEYAKNMLESVVEKWNPKHFKLYAYYHDFDINSVDAPQSETIEYRNLNDIQEMLQYRERMKQHDGTHGGTQPYNWRLDAIKWCHKVYALSDLAFEMMEEEAHDESNWMIWLDADTVTTKRLDIKQFPKWLPDKADLVHLGRKDADYSETSFLGFNLSSHNTCSIIADFRGAYTIGETISYREWHDGFIFERLLNIYKAHGMVTKNLSEHATGLAAFAQSPLSEYFNHYKGNLKKKLSNTEVAPDVTGPRRYKQLADMIRFYKPSTILETGTWNGGRAVEMALAAFENTDKVHYIGFDLFEEATEESDAYEMNSKAHNMVEAVEKRLHDFAVRMVKTGKEFTFELYKGDSKKTLPACERLKDVDFAYIDGGHSYETVKADWENIKDYIPVVVFDDFFSKDKQGNLPKEEHLGVNKLMEEIEAYGKVVLPSADGVLGGGVTHLCFVANKKGLAKLPDELTRVPIVVTPRDSRPKQEIIDNVKANSELIEDFDFIKTSKVNDETAIIVSGGKIDFKKLKQRIKATNNKVFCVKHSYPKLLEKGIKPFACVILDPRPIDGTSTHGIVRKDLFKKVDKETIFLVASMTDPSVTKHLISKGANVKGWQAYSDALRDMNIKDKIVVDKETGIDEGATLITGGTCAAMRTLAIGHTLGFRNFELFGFDCSVDEVTEEMKKETTDTENNKPKYMKVELAGKHFWTTGELLAMAQDCEKLFEQAEIDMGIIFHGEDTLCAQVFENSMRGQEKHYSELLNVAA
jgi:predicted O-methyltransferase YrrM